MINLYYNYFTHEKQERYSEIRYCFEKLIGNHYIDKCYVILNVSDFESFKTYYNDLLSHSDKLIIIKKEERPKYKDFFELAKKYSEDYHVNIIINSDCFLDQDDTIKLISMDKNDFYCLSRINILSLDPLELNFDQCVSQSQDCWIFKGKPNNISSDMYMGVKGCDNAIAYEILKSGYNVINIPYDIKVYHYHISEIGTEKDRGERWVKENYHHLPRYCVNVFQNGKIIDKERYVEPSLLNQVTDIKIPLPKKKINESKVNLYFNYYVDDVLERNVEIEFCLRELYSNHRIDRYFIFLNDSDIKSFNEKFTHKNTQIFIVDRPKFKDFFDVSRNFGDSDINIIINSDCFIDTYDIIKLNKIQDDDFYCLSRHDIININDFKLNTDHIYNASQDCWIFRGKARLVRSDFFLGYAGCDNVIAYYLKEAGYKEINCAHDIKIYHYHLSAIDRKNKWNKLNYNHFNSSFVDVIKKDGEIEKGRDNINEKIKKSAYFLWTKGTKFSFMRYLTLYSFRLNHPDWDIYLYLGNSKTTKKWDGYQQADFITNQSKEDFLYDLLDIGVKIIPHDRYSDLNPVYISDIIRWDILTENEGGWYFDTDQIFLKSFDDLCKYDFVYGSKNYVGIGVLGVSKNSKLPSIFQKIVHDSMNKELTKYVQLGNGLFEQSLNNGIFKEQYNKENVFNTPDNYFYPVKWDSPELIYKGKIDFKVLDSYAVHWYGGNPDTQEFNKNYTSSSYKMGKDSISTYLRDINFDVDKSLYFNINNYNEYKDKNIPKVIEETYSRGKYKILVKFPVRNRVDKFFDTLDKYYELLSDLENTKFVISCDIDDSAMNNKIVRKKLDEYKNLTYYFGNSSNKIESINADIVDMDWDIILLASDDMIPKVRGYDDIIRENMGRYYPDTDGVLWFYDGFRRDLNTLCILGKNYYNRFNYIYNPDYVSLWCDMEFTEVGNILRRQTFIDKCIIKHEHFAFGYGNSDDLYLKNSQYYEKDKETYERRKKNNYFIEKEASYNENKKNIIEKENNPFNNFVDKTYVINLERRKDRLKHITEEMQKIGVSFTRFNAIDGKTLKLNFNEVKKSQIGCYRSHIGVIKDALKNNFNTIAVFEDDVIFCKDFQTRFKYYSENIPGDWDIMYLGCHFHDCPEPIPLKNNISLVKESYGCFAMILNNKNGLFNKIIDNANDIRQAYDDYIKTLQSQLKCYVFMPFFVRTLNTVSDISNSKNSFSYEIVDKHFQNEFTIPVPVVQKPISVKPPPPQIHHERVQLTQQEICEDYLRSNVPFVIYYGGRIIFDSSMTDKMNLSFWQDHFTLYGKIFPYQNMLIKAK